MSKKANNIQYRLSLKGLPTANGEITFSTLQEIMAILTEGSERALRLALEGVSVKRGNIPAWLSQSTDFVLKGIKKGSTILEIEAPTIGSVAQEQISQPDLWNVIPSPDETAISILSKSVKDAQREELDSELYDPGVLDALLGFKRLLDGTTLKIELSSKQRRADRFSLDRHSYETIRKIKSETPEPQAVVLTGYLNMIKHNQRRYELLTEDNQTIKGGILEESINLEQIRNLWGKKVTVKGILQYTPSKKPRFLEAEVISSRQAGDEIFSTIPIAFQVSDILMQAQKNVPSQNIISEIWGKWPGDESIDELLDDLKINQ